jgi:hypothetical protein
MRGHPIFVAQHATATCCRQPYRIACLTTPPSPMSSP